MVDMSLMCTPEEFQREQEKEKIRKVLIDLEKGKSDKIKRLIFDGGKMIEFKKYNSLPLIKTSGKLNMSVGPKVGIDVGNPMWGMHPVDNKLTQTAAERNAEKLRQSFPIDFKANYEAAIDKHINEVVINGVGITATSCNDAEEVGMITASPPYNITSATTATSTYAENALPINTEELQKQWKILSEYFIKPVLDKERVKQTWKQYEEYAKTHTVIEYEFE